MMPNLRDDVQPLPAQGYAAGPLDLLDHNPIAVYSSRRMPLSVLESAEATIWALTEAGVVLARAAGTRGWRNAC